AKQYAGFLRAVVEGADWPEVTVEAAPEALPCAPEEARPPVPEKTPAAPETILRWAPPDPLFREYVDLHLTRLTKTLDLTPPGGPGDAILEMGAYLQITPALSARLGYGEVRGCYYGPLGKVERRAVVSEDGERFECDLELFDAEKDAFPYPDGHFATVLCCELIEHLFGDPMHLMSEANRILRGGGHMLLTTPNIASLRAISAALQGYHPGLFPQYIKPRDGGVVDPRHNREYTPREIRRLFEDSGFETVRLETGPFREQPQPELAWVRRLLERYQLDTALRDDGIYALGRKTGPVRVRYPDWLYA
ncbi:MAG TPA: class I SAM-dependent methyltransferase, partial [Bryobacteraceae bacterium]